MPVLKTSFEFDEIESTHFEVADPSGQTFRRLPEEVRRGGSQKQKLTVQPTLFPIGVNDSATRSKQNWTPLDFTQTHDPLPVQTKKSDRVIQLELVFRRLEVEID
mgnify:CR=1 FL=1